MQYLLLLLTLCSRSVLSSGGLGGLAHRPTYHLLPQGSEAGWISDPNGPIYYKGRYHVLRGLSHEVVDKVNDATLDFVYIDANHSYDAVRQDLRDWYPKLKPGGIIAGDDYTINPLERINSSSVFGVKKAVDEFVLEHKKNVSIDLEGVWYYTSKEESGTEHYIACRNWWFVK